MRHSSHSAHEDHQPPALPLTDRALIVHAATWPSALNLSSPHNQAHTPPPVRQNPRRTRCCALHTHVYVRSQSARSTAAHSLLRRLPVHLLRQLGVVGQLLIHGGGGNARLLSRGGAQAACSVSVCQRGQPPWAPRRPADGGSAAAPGRLRPTGPPGCNNATLPPPRRAALQGAAPRSNDRTLSRSMFCSSCSISLARCSEWATSASASLISAANWAWASDRSICDSGRLMPGGRGVEGTEGQGQEAAKACSASRIPGCMQLCP